MRYVLALDQGTTSSRAIVFDQEARPLATAQQEHPQQYPAPGLVEHDPEALWASQLTTARKAIDLAGLSASDIAAIGITNQRETTLLWERATGRPVSSAIVWQDRRTASVCEQLRRAGAEEQVQHVTGLRIDPYFSATKLAWLLDHVPDGRARATRGELAFGTVDTFLLWRLTGGRIHATDVSNASRTLLMDLRTLDWDQGMLDLFGIPRQVLPEILPSSHIYGETDPALLGVPIPIASMAGDQQAATFGQVCLTPGMVKNTYGTGSFLLMNTGDTPRASRSRLLTTVAWRLADGPPTYALEGSIFATGAAIQWLRDELGIVRSAAETEALAASVSDTGGVYFVPAFVGLGAPYWDSEARGAIVGITRGTSRAHIARAALAAACFQTRDVLRAMEADAGSPIRCIRVDGGMTANSLLLQMQADVLGLPVLRPAVTETTALGAAFLAGLAVGVWPDATAVASTWRAEREFLPAISPEARDRLYAGWNEAVRRVRSRR